MSREELQILYDFKLFIREGMFYNCSDDLLNEFAIFMDDLYYPKTRYYYSMFINIIENKELLFTNLNSSLSCVHLNDIKLFINNYFSKYHLNKISDDNRKKYDIALYDFKMSLKSHELIYISDLYSFAYYMKGFYKKIPYFEVADILYLLKNNQSNIIDIDFYLKFLSSECINLANFTAGHFMEICNYSPKVLIKS